MSGSWSTSREALAVEALRRTGRLRLQVRGESMLPALWPGNIVEITACRLSEVGPNEIVLALRDNRLFLHRFLTRNSDGFLTRGDAMPGPDPVFSSEALLGKLVGVLRGDQIVAAPSRSWSRALGLVFCYCSPARRLALKFHSWRHSRLVDVANLETA